MPRLNRRSYCFCLVIVIGVVASWLLLTQLSFPIRAEPSPTTATATATATAQPTPTPIFSVTVQVTPTSLEVLNYQPLTVTVAIKNHSVGCQYPVYDLTLRQSSSGSPIFTFTSPAVVGPGVGEITIYTLTAQATGAVTLTASAYGEQNCGSGWFWHYVNGTSPLITVREPPAQLYLSPIHASRQNAD